MPPEDNPADERPITQPEHEAGERALLTPGPWRLREVMNGELDDYYEIEGPAPEWDTMAPAPILPPTIARVFTSRADAMAIRCAAEWWDALNEIAFTENMTAGELRELARNAMGKR